MPSPLLYFGTKESDILYPSNFTERNKVEPGVERGLQLKRNEATGEMEFFTSKGSAGKRPLTALEMMEAREKIRLKCCDNIRANKPPSWSAAQLADALARFNEVYARYVYGTLGPHYTKCGNTEVMLRAIQDFDAKLFSEIYNGRAQLENPNSYNHLVMEKIYSVMATPAPRAPAVRSAGMCSYYNRPGGCTNGDNCSKVHKCSACGSTSHGAATCHKRHSGGGGGSGSRKGGGSNNGNGNGGGGGGGGGQSTKGGRADGDRYRPRGRR